MFVDTGLLRMGAEFSKSAGDIVKRGANEFSSTALPAGIFGDFDVAHDFHQALRSAHETQVTTMQSHYSRFEGLAEKAEVGAAAFAAQDEASKTALRAAGMDVD